MGLASWTDLLEVSEQRFLRVEPEFFEGVEGQEDGACPEIYGRGD